MTAIKLVRAATHRDTRAGVHTRRHMRVRLSRQLGQGEMEMRRKRRGDDEGMKEKKEIAASNQGKRGDNNRLCS